MDSLNRRQFVARGGGLLASLAALSSAWPGLLAKAMGAEPGLTEARRRTYLALVAACGEGWPQVSETDALAALEAWYEAQPDEQRRQVEALLDTIEANEGKRPFSELSKGAAGARVATWSNARTKREREFEAQAHKAGRWSKPGDFEGSLRASEKRIAEVVREVKLQFGEDALDIDRESGLPRWSPHFDQVAHKPCKPDKKTAESGFRALGAAAYSLAALPHEIDRAPEALTR
ncbi:MAG: hypothetical protein M3340_05415 [Actinomycetota bacterium]|nr:hypothetical protein [Actinomycetota bacterium]